MTSSGAGRRTVGVLGGMGPAATVDFLAKIIAATPAARDQEHVPTIVWNCPQIPDRSAAILRGDDAPFAAMARGLAGLEAAGADLVAIPCNTAHYWYDRLTQTTNLPILHMADAVAAKARTGGDRVGLMATRGTIAAGIYHRRWPKGVEIILPEPRDQDLIDMAITAVKAGGRRQDGIEAVIERLLARGASQLVLGCTELPIAAAGSCFANRCIDATQALAEACVEASAVQVSALNPRLGDGRAREPVATTWPGAHS